MPSMNSARFAIKHRYVIFSLLLAVLFFGLAARFTIKTELFPDTTPPLVNIMTPYPGAEAQTVSKDIDEILEKELATVPGVRRIKASSQDGLSLVTVEFHYGTDQDLAALDVQNTIDRIAYKMPANIGNPQVLKFSTTNKPIITLAVTSDKIPLSQVRTLAEDELAQEIQLLPGVASVDVFGGHERSINILLDKTRLSAYNLSPEEVTLGLKQQNIDFPGGKLIHDQEELSVTLNASISDLTAVNNTLIKNMNGRAIYIRDVAQVEEGIREQQSQFRQNGEPAIALRVIKRDDANTVAVAKDVKDLVKDLSSRYTELNFAVADDDSVFTQLVLNNMSSSIFLALVFTAVIVLLFIVKTTDTFVIAFSMPFSILTTMACMKAFGLTLNLITMSAIILSIGFIVDNSIVVLENISRHNTKLNKPIVQAAIDGTGEVMLDVMAGTSTTIVVLIPFLFLKGFVGRVFGPLAATLAIALSASYLVAVLIVPLWAVLLHGREIKFLERAFAFIAHPFLKFIDWLRSAYVHLLLKVLPQRVPVLIILAMVLALGGRTLVAQGMEVLPKMDNGTFTIYLETTPGSSLEQTSQVVHQVEKLLIAEPEVQDYSSNIGYEQGARYLGGRGAMGVNQAEITVNLSTRKERAEDIWSIMGRAREQISLIPGINTFVVKEVGGAAIATTAAPIDIQISGQDPALLEHLTGQILNRIQNVPGVINLYTGWERSTPSVEVKVDRARALALGLTPAAIGQQLFTAIEGQTATTLATDSKTSTDLVVRYDKSQRQTTADLLDTTINSPLKVQIPLKAVATAEVVKKPLLLTREDFSLTNDIYGFTYGRPLTHIVRDIKQELDQIELPAGYQVALKGEQQDLLDSRRDMITVLAIGVVAVYLLLLAQLGSFTDPLVIMSSIPLVIIGVAAALIISRKAISMPVLLGLILLVGTVVNNAIILLDQIKRNRENGQERTDAIVDAVNARFRPVLMTAVSDIAGMLPLALELSLGSERFSPLAVAVIGGITAATFLTTIIIPTIYTLIDDLKARLLNIQLTDAGAKSTI